MSLIVFGGLLGLMWLALGPRASRASCKLPVGRWVRLAPTPDPSWVAYQLTPLGSTLFASFRSATEQGLYYSDDCGSHWGKFSFPATSGELIAPSVIAIAPSDPLMIYAGTDVGDCGESGALFRSDDGGESWTQLRLGSPEALTVDPSNPDHMFGIFIAGCMDPDFLGESVDGGRTWRGLARRGWPIPTEFNPVNPAIAYGLEAERLSRSEDGGETWKLLDPGGTVDGFAIDPSSPRVLYAATLGGFSRSTDGGDHWKIVGPRTWGTPLEDCPTPHVASGPVIYTTGIDCHHLLRSIDGGVHFSPMVPPIPGGGAFWMAIGSDPPVLYVAGNGGLYAFHLR